MARSNAVWGIDVGQCALKALKCRAHDDADKVVVEAFDYIEYPKILTQPDANPAELIADALKQFLSRNSLGGDRVAISLSGQSGLARFIKLPPVETKKVPDIVRYEARQQIPFDLNDVIWDYQRMGGGSEEEGFALETEIGLFAIKRDVVFRAMEPFQEAGIEVDFVQLTPLTLYNFVLFDQMGDLPPPDQYDPEDPPESVAMISLGTDATDLVVTNGYRVWQRSVPIGGSHFTKALTKDLKLTFAKAEHLKRNATSAADPKAVFQAMRPVFNDLLTELDRSLHHFATIDRSAKITRVLGLGSAFKLPGLRRYLSQSLGHEIERVESFRGMVGPEVMATPAFKENILSFGVCYGLALQALGKSGLKTNLLPKEIRRDRLIREKKPWALAAAAVVLLGVTVSLAAYSLTLNTMNAAGWGDSERAAKAAVDRSQRVIKEAEEAKKKFEATKITGDHLISNVEGRNRWRELLDAINQALPKEKPASLSSDRNQIRIEIAARSELVITNIECQPVEDVGIWWAWVKKQPWYKAPPDGSGGQLLAQGPRQPQPSPGAPGGTSADPSASPGSSDGPSGPAYIVQIYGHHYHNADTIDQGPEFVRRTLVQKLANGSIVLPLPEGNDVWLLDDQRFNPRDPKYAPQWDSWLKAVRLSSSDPKFDDGAMRPRRLKEEERRKVKEGLISMKDIGISHPVLINPQKVRQEMITIPGSEGKAVTKDSTGPKPGDDNYDPSVHGGGGIPGGTGDAGGEKVPVPYFEFRVQFVWVPTPPTKRIWLPPPPPEKPLLSEKQLPEKQLPAAKPSPESPAPAAPPRAVQPEKGAQS